MTGTVESQYSTGLSRNNIERALIAAGKELAAPPAGRRRALADGRLRAFQGVAVAKDR